MFYMISFIRDFFFLQVSEFLEILIFVESPNNLIFIQHFLDLFS
jgi:hypothetical protein